MRVSFPLPVRNDSGLARLVDQAYLSLACLRIALRKHSPDSNDSELEMNESDAPDNRGASERFWDWARDTLGTWGPALLTVLVVRSCIAEPFRIPSGSMVPTLEIGDHILVTKYSYGFRIPLTRIPVSDLSVPDRGDVVVFVHPPSDHGTTSRYLDMPFPTIATVDYVKRVVGLPGDTIEVRNNVLFINDEPQVKDLIEDYEFIDDRCSSHQTRLYSEEFGEDKHMVLTDRSSSSYRRGDYGPVTVPDGEVFTMGDNRDYSADSRSWGFVPLQNIKGKARFIWLSYDQCSEGIPIFGRLRTERFGEPIR